MARWIIIALLLFPNIALGGVYVSGGVDPVEIGRRIAVSSPGVITLASGSVTLSNTKLSAVDGTAFVDFSTANVLTDYIPYKGKLTITDSTGKKLVGYIKAAGTGEVWAERITAQNDRDFSGGTIGNWTVITGGGGNGTVAYDAGTESGKITVGTTPGTTTLARLATSQMDTLPASGGIIKVSTDVFIPASYVAGAIYISDGGSFSGVTAQGTNVNGNLSLRDQWQTISRTYLLGADVTGSIDVRSDSTTAADHIFFKNNSVTQLVTPSTTGVTITSTADGTTYNWESKESGFNYNDASGYTYAITTR